MLSKSQAIFCFVCISLYIIYKFIMTILSIYYLDKYNEYKGDCDHILNTINWSYFINLLYIIIYFIRCSKIIKILTDIEFFNTEMKQKLLYLSFYILYFGSGIVNIIQYSKIQCYKEWNDNVPKLKILNDVYCIEFLLNIILIILIIIIIIYRKIKKYWYRQNIKNIEMNIL
jgi:hypothetical protein